MLGFLDVAGGDLTLTPTGKEFTTADVQRSKQIFAAEARDRPAGAHTCSALASSTDGNLRAGFFLDLLRRGFSAPDARRRLDAAIDRARYAELFDDDTDTDQITADPAAGIFPRPPGAVHA